VDIKKLLRYSFWVGPILLGISAIGWQKPIDFPIQMPLFFRIIGVIGGLWMAFSFLIPSKKTNFWVTVIIGLSGIDIATICAIGLEAVRAQLLYSTATLQAIYVFYILLKTVISKTESKVRATKRQINRQLRKILPSWLLWLSSISKNFLGFFVVCLISSIMWAVMVTTPENVLHIVRYIPITFLGSGFGIITTIPIMILADGTILQFKKTKAPAKKHLIENAILLLLYGLILSIILYAVGGWLFVTIYLFILILVCYCWYRFLLGLLQKAAKSDYHECIQKILTQENVNTLKALDQRIYFPTVSCKNEGIEFQNIQGNKLYPWPKIKYIHLNEGSAKSLWLHIEDEKGNSSKGRLPVRKVKKEVEKIWTLWSENADVKCNKFEYPGWKITSDKQNDLLEGIILSACGLIGTPLIIQFLISQDQSFLHTLSGLAIISLISIFGIGFAVSGIQTLLSRKRKRLAQISVNESNCIITYDDDSREIKQFNQIQTYDLGIHADGAWIKFKDKTKLKNLDKLSYWPLLRDFLLQELHVENPVKLF
jgi:hypothetical protein